MSKAKLASRLAIAVGILVGLTLPGIRPNYARVVDCEDDLFNAFMNADSQYTTTFRSWYFGEPVSCSNECGQTCGQFTTGSTQWQNCMVECTANCENSRNNDYMNAQSALMGVASQGCSYNPDQCAVARARRDQCVAMRFAQLENPVYDENGHYDPTWRSYVMDEYMACWSASGIGSCE